MSKTAFFHFRERIHPAYIHKVRKCLLFVHSEVYGDQNKGLSAHLGTLLWADDYNGQHTAMLPPCLQCHLGGRVTDRWPRLDKALRVCVRVCVRVGMCVRACVCVHLSSQS